jgi:hypothetical protein
MIDLLLMFLVAVVALLVAGALLAPVEALGWWAGWSEHGAGIEEAAATIRAAEAGLPAEADRFVVFLCGISAEGGDALPEEETGWVHRLQEQLSSAVVIDDVFPYSVTNTALTGDRPFAGFWRWMAAQREAHPRSPVFKLSSLRNTFEVLVSADSRYGPIYNLGMAKEILLGLMRHGYRVERGTPVTLIGSSGGGQIAVGATRYLAGVIQAPIHVVSLAGVVSDDPGIDAAGHIDHLYGSNDTTPTRYAVIFPGRWPLLSWSRWNRAVQRGAIQARLIGPMVHSGSGSYFDPMSVLPDGQNFRDSTVETVTLAIEAADTALTHRRGAAEENG